MTDTRAEGLQVFWRGEAQASTRAWREAERLLELPRRAAHFSLNAAALALITNSSWSIEIGERLKAQVSKCILRDTLNRGTPHLLSRPPELGSGPKI